MKKFSYRKTLLALVCVVILLTAISTAYIYFYYKKDHSDMLITHYSTIQSSEITPISSDSISLVYSILIRTETLPELLCYLRIPAHRQPSPVMILLGGLNTGREVINIVGETELTGNFVYMSMDYPYEGKKKNVPALEFFRAIPSIRKAAFNAVGAVLTMIDYLETLPEVNKEQIFVTGVSFGAYFAIASGALDTARIKAVASLYGGGDMSMLIAENIQWGPGFLRKSAGFLAELLMLPVEPLRYVDRISPRHFLMVNGSEDEKIPRESVQKLFEKAQQPKELIWFETKHIQPTKSELTQELTEIVNQWLQEKNLVSRGLIY